MTSKLKQDTLRFPIRKTRSRLTDIQIDTIKPCITTRKMGKLLNHDRSREKMIKKSPKKISDVSDDENSPDDSVLKSIDCESDKHMQVSNEVNPTQLTRSPLKDMSVLDNTYQNSPVKSKCNITPKVDKKLSSKCSSLLNLGSPRRSPRKLNFENSPSRLINKLSLISPKKSGTVIGLHSVELSIYQALKASLTQNCDTELVGREAETNTLKDFLGSHLQSTQPGSLYISGAPGTGKTALVTHIMKSFNSIKFQVINLNCMSQKSSKDIFCCIAKELNLPQSCSERERIQLIEKSLTRSKIPVVMVLDEMDQLETKDQTILYTLFEWPALTNSKLILIGIANMLDLTDRILPRLRSIKTFTPQLLHFSPYSRAEIVSIINQRIKKAGVDGFQIIKPSAVQFLAGKVAAVAGDVRKALDVCRRAVELCEIQTRKQLRLVSRSSSKSPKKSSNQNLKQIDIPQILSIFNEVYGSRVSSAISENSQALPLQQKILICSLLLMLKNLKTKHVNLGKFHEVYRRVCTRQKLPSVEQSEFFYLCVLLEDRGILEVKKTKEIRNSKILLRLDEGETIDILGDKDLLADVLDDHLSLKPKTNI